MTPFLDAAWQHLSDCAGEGEAAPIGTEFVVISTYYAKLQTAFSRGEGFAHELRDYAGPGRGRFPATALLFAGGGADWGPVQAIGAPARRLVRVLR